jgi:hypothetical protein
MDLKRNIASFSPSNNIRLVLYKAVLSPILLYSYLPAFAQFSTITSKELNERILAKNALSSETRIRRQVQLFPATNNID